MKKVKDLNALRKKPEGFNRELQSEVMEDHERHFAEGMAEGRSEDLRKTLYTNHKFGSLLYFLR